MEILSVTRNLVVRIQASDCRLAWNIAENWLARILEEDLVIKHPVCGRKQFLSLNDTYRILRTLSPGEREKLSTAVRLTAEQLEGEINE
jgi:hypothetical protein